ncbi:MAG TPA: hypothetical protein VGL61_31285 [Kofleriaceae bacterium]|jgi:hypothetical protein
MRALALAAALAAGVVLASGAALAEPLPSGAIGVVTGGVAGTGADNATMGYGFYAFGAQASWQPTTTENHLGWTIRWSTMFGILYGGNAARIDSSLRTVQMDFTAGVRLRPWATVTRYLTLRGGICLLRSNDPIATAETSTSLGDRDFLGPIASVGIDQYIAGALMLDVDVRYGMIAVGGPATIALLVGIGFAGP